MNKESGFKNAKHTTNWFTTSPPPHKGDSLDSQQKKETLVSYRTCVPLTPFTYWNVPANPAGILFFSGILWLLSFFLSSSASASSSSSSSSGAKKKGD